jgi:hypothetical protein
VHHAGIVPLGLLDFHQMPAVTAESAADAALAGVVLPLATGALDEQSHKANLISLAQQSTNY